MLKGFSCKMVLWRVASVGIIISKMLLKIVINSEKKIALKSFGSGGKPCPTSHIRGPALCKLGVIAIFHTHKY